MKNPPWSRDEHIIALDFYLRYAPSIPGKDSKEVIALSELLNILGRKITGVGLNQLLLSQRQALLIEDQTIDIFNIGMNCGETAGQSVWHCHKHLIPRRKGDVENPRGGVRHIIAGKGFYEDRL